MPTERTKSTAFTLTELLVVMAILAVVAALLFPAFARVKRSAQRLACLNNLKQWTLAAKLYADDNSDWLPRESAIDGINTWEMAGASTNRDVWYNALAGKLTIAGMIQYAQTPSSQQGFYSRGNLFHCPSARFSDVAATYPNFSLAINSKLMGDFETDTPPPPGPIGPTALKMSQIDLPAKTALFLDCGVPGEDRISPFQNPYTGQPKACANQFSGRHNNAGNIAFADGHVATLTVKVVVEMDPSSPYRGGAIFPPGEVVWRPDPTQVP